MLPFMRKHAAVIVISVLVFFLATMFAGAVFFGGGVDLGSLTQSNAPDRTNQIAFVGQNPVHQKKFAEYLEQNAAQFQQSNQGSISPEIIELIQYSSFLKAVQFTVFLEKATENNIKVGKIDLKIGLENVYKNFDIRGMKELKALLKNNNYPYRIFIDALKEDILAQKVLDSILASVVVTEQDVKNTFTQVKVQHILLRPKTDETVQELQQRMAQIQEKLKEGQSFTQLAKTYSDDTGTAQKGGKMDWVKIGDTVLEFEKVAFALDRGELSQPVLTPFGLHLIQVVDRKTFSYPKAFDMGKAKEDLKNKKGTQFIDSIVQAHIKENPLDVIHPGIRAYKAKSEGNVQDAIAAYQVQISQNPENSVPHYFLAQIYKILKNKKLQEDELLKADIKAQLNPRYAFPGIHLELGAFYKSKKMLKEKKEQYNKAIDVVSSNLGGLKQIKVAFTQLKEPLLAKKVEKLIVDLEKKQKESQKEDQ